MRASQGELGRRIVIKPRAAPLLGYVACSAVGRKTCGCVIGTCRLCVILHVAAAARCSGSLVNIAGVTLAAGRSGVRAGEREAGRGIVIESGASPLLRGVANRAVARKAGRNMVGIGCRFKYLTMTPGAVRTDAGVTPPRMTLPAIGRYMRPGQPKTTQVVVELCSRPGRCGVAGFASRGEVAPAVIGIGRRLKVAGVATQAVLRSPGKPPGYVAGNALSRDMRACECESRSRVMVESGALPGGIVMTHRAV